MNCSRGKGSSFFFFFPPQISLLCCLGIAHDGGRSWTEFSGSHFVCGRFPHEVCVSRNKTGRGTWGGRGLINRGGGGGGGWFDMGGAHVSKKAGGNILWWKFTCVLVASVGLSVPGGTTFSAKTMNHAVFIGVLTPSARPYCRVRHQSVGAHGAAVCPSSYAGWYSRVRTTSSDRAAMIYDCS